MEALLRAEELHAKGVLQIEHGVDQQIYKRLLAGKEVAPTRQSIENDVDAGAAPLLDDEGRPPKRQRRNNSDRHGPHWVKQFANDCDSAAQGGLHVSS